jgi:hypothetical protein
MMIYPYFYQMLWRIGRQIRLTYLLQKLINESCIGVPRTT